MGLNARCCTGCHDVYWTFQINLDIHPFFNVVWRQGNISEVKKWRGATQAMAGGVCWWQLCWQPLLGDVGAWKWPDKGFVQLHIRNGFMCHIMGHKLSHIYAREVRWNIEFDSWYSSKICLCLSNFFLHSLYLLFLIMSTLKSDVRVKIFHFTIFLFRLYVKKGEYRIEFVCRNVIF